jgi:hypothetical protein
MTENGRQSGVHETIPAAPFTSAGGVRADRTNFQKVSASCSGSMPSARLEISPGECALEGPSSLERRERSMSRHTTPTTVVSHPPRFSMRLVSVADQAEPGFLEGVLGLADAAEHPIGHRPQVGVVSVESVCRPFVFFRLCHNSSSRYVILVVTCETRPM